MCVCVCVWARICAFECVCVCVCVKMKMCTCFGVHVITIIFLFTSAPVNDDNVWELHTRESDVFMWRAVQDWVLKSVRVHGIHASPSSRKQHRLQALTREREGPDSKKVSRIIGQAALTLLPKGFAETVPWNFDYFTHTSVQSVSRVLRFQRKTPSVQTNFTQVNEDAKHCHIQTKKKEDQRSVCLGHKYGTVSEQVFREHEKRKEESK